MGDYSSRDSLDVDLTRSEYEIISVITWDILGTTLRCTGNHMEHTWDHIGHTWDHMELGWGSAIPLYPRKQVLV